MSSAMEPLDGLEEINTLQDVVGTADRMQQYLPEFLVDYDENELMLELMELEKEAEAGECSILCIPL